MCCFFNTAKIYHNQGTEVAESIFVVAKKYPLPKVLNSKRWSAFIPGIGLRCKYGLYYGLHSVSEVTIDFATTLNDKASLRILHDAQKDLYQSLWRTYFGSTNIQARRNMKLHIQHIPRRYRKY
jgi:hypothetical protein